MLNLEYTRFVPAETGVVWQNLVCVEVLQRCIPGCKSMEQTGDGEYELAMNYRVGPLSANFHGVLSLHDIVPGESYTLRFAGRGGTNQGSAVVRIEPIDGGTRLHYTVDAMVGGRFARLGQGLVDRAARRIAEDFFDTFERVVAARGTDPAR